MGRDKRILSGQDLAKNLQQFKRFNAKRKFKAGVKTVMAHNRMKNLMEGLRAAADEENGNTDSKDGPPSY
jgi:hypothetical protein